MRAAVYLRQSLDRTGLGAAVDRQREDCLKVCEQRGWTVVEQFRDNDVSASSGKPRKHYRRMIDTVKGGNADVVVVWDLDRLTRRPIEVEEWMTLHEQHGVNLVTIGENVDLATDNGRMFLRIKAAVARAEVERKGARQSRAQQQAAQLGKPAGGRRAFGYSADSLTVNEAEARHVRAAYQAMLEGGTLRGIASRWNAEGVLTTAGNPWGHSAVRRVLLNPRNVARRTYRGEVVGPALWPPLVDLDTFEAVRGLLRMPERNTTTGTARLYLLPGLALCYCGSPVTTGRTQHGVRTYRCRNRGNGHDLSRAAEPIDELVAALVVERLSRSDAAELLHDTTKPDLEAHRVKAQAIRERLDDLATALADGLLPLPAVRKSSERLHAELADVEAQMANLDRTDVLGPVVTAADVGEAWQMLDLDRKRAVIDTLLTVTLLRPLRGRQRFDPETVRIEWRTADA